MMFYRMFIFLMSIICVSSVNCASIPDELEKYKVLKIWDFNDSMEGWTADHNINRVEAVNGSLEVDNGGADPWIINREIGIDISEYSFIAVKMKSNSAGINQIYFSTKDSPEMDNRKVMAFELAGDGEYHVQTVNMAETGAWKGILDALRIDAANGYSESEAKSSIDWVAIYQKPAEAILDRPYVYVNGGKICVNIPVKNIGGLRFEKGISVSCGSRIKRLPEIKPLTSETASFILPMSDKPIEAIGKYKNKQIFSVRLISPYKGRSLSENAGNDRISISYAPDIVNLTEFFTNSSIGDRRKAGEFRPMAALAYKDSSGLFRYIEFEAYPQNRISDSRLLLNRKMKVGINTLSAEWTFNFEKDSDSVTCASRISCDLPIEIFRFEGPRFLVGEGSFGRKKDAGIFPGLEYLGKDELSNMWEFTGKKFANRRVPHPYKITIPAMVIEQDGMSAGISWDPNSEWASGERLISAEFESPNKSEGADNHLLTLFAPSIPDYINEDEDFARKPYILKPGEEISISASFFANTKSAPEAIAYKMSNGKLDLPKSIESAIETCFKAYTETLYSREINGWKPHIGLKQKYQYNPSNVALILAESIRSGSPDLADKCGISTNSQIIDYIGYPSDWFDPGIKSDIYALIERQSEDGGFPYVESDQVKKTIAEIVPDEYRNFGLGVKGETNSGLIGKEIIGILSFALKTGDEKAIKSGLLGLDKMNSYNVPRGAQGWEVHVHAPDIYAAGISVEANIMGYQLTGDEKYLDKAKFWAYTGIPFVYSWVTPIDSAPKAIAHLNDNGEGEHIIYAEPSEFYDNIERQINPGAAIAVFGTTFYLSGWYGNPVQWCGLSYINNVRHYLRLRPDPILRHIVDNLFASAIWQQNEKGFLAGTYTDSWNLLTNITSQVYITPDLILQNAYSMLDEKRPFEIDSFGFSVNGKRSVFNTYARIESSETEGNIVKLKLKFYKNQYLCSSVSNCEEPANITLDGIELGKSDNIRNDSDGFFYDRENRSLHIKYKCRERLSELAIVMSNK